MSDPRALSTTPFVGLTGGIASGKSTVANAFASYGIACIDADRLARQVVVPGSPALEQIVVAFGRSVLRSDGSLHRQALAAIVFADAAARRRLEAIMHPRIDEAARAALAELGLDAPLYVLYEAALLVETGKHRSMTALIVVEADDAVRLARLMQRDGLSAEAARQRLAAQLPSDVVRQHADWCIRTNGTLADTQRQVDVVHRQLLQKLLPTSRS